AVLVQQEEEFTGAARGVGVVAAAEPEVRSRALHVDEVESRARAKLRQLEDARDRVGLGAVVLDEEPPARGRRHRLAEAIEKPPEEREVRGVRDDAEVNLAHGGSS